MTGKLSLQRAVDLRSVREKVQNAAGIAPLVVIPRNELDEIFVQGDSGLRVKDGRLRGSDEIRGNNIVLSVSENSL